MGLELGIEIGDWNRDWGLGLGLGIWIGDWGLDLTSPSTSCATDRQMRSNKNIFLQLQIRLHSACVWTKCNCGLF